MSPAYFARLHLTGKCFSAWCSSHRSSDPYPWLRVNLSSPRYILFVATQGSDKEQDRYHVSSYYLSYLHEDDGKATNYTENGNLKVEKLKSRSLGGCIIGCLSKRVVNNCNVGNGMRTISSSTALKLRCVKFWE